MDKANILDFFAWSTLIIGVFVTSFFVFSSVQAAQDGAVSYLISLGVFLWTLFQFAVLGGAAEVVRRLVSIDETLQAQTYEDALPRVSSSANER